MNERMTRREADGQAVMDCKKCEADWVGKHCKPMVECTALYCRNRLKDRLAEYEDMGLTPERVTEMAHDTTGPLHRKIGEWMEADAAGCLVVLPCKVGDTVYVIDKGDYEHDYQPYVRAKAVYEITCKSKKNGTRLGWGVCLGPGDCGTVARYRLDKLGQSWFLTREEAEKALKEGKQK